MSSVLRYTPVCKMTRYALLSNELAEHEWAEQLEQRTERVYLVHVVTHAVTLVKCLMPAG